MPTQIDLHDVQGNIVRGYGRWGFPKARYMCYRIVNADAARVTIRKLIPLVTTGAPWTRDGKYGDGSQIPRATLNIAWTYEGLKRIGVPEASLHSFPDDFCMGMKARRDILGDDGPSAPDAWDPVWGHPFEEQTVHLMLWTNAVDADAVDERYLHLVDIVGNASSGIELKSGHRIDADSTLEYQDASAIFVDGQPTAKEHFGYTDGISDPFFEGSGSNPLNVIGGGKPTGEDPRTYAGWKPLETGEFLLGYKDEAFEYPKAPLPPLLSRNGTFMVYRKLHQNVASFEKYLDDFSDRFGGKEVLAAKFAGRWRNGAPLTTFATEDEANRFANELECLGTKVRGGIATEADQQRHHALNLELKAFNYNDDIAGARCPVGAHMRRMNPRGALQFGKDQAFEEPGALVNRRRILRRGLPYGDATLDPSDQGNHGVIFIVLNASIKRQFEFVQQQWIILAAPNTGIFEFRQTGNNCRK
ncbi:MAG: peroxidase, partial [Planctomycetota bacterium]|nr:peroxidase [Planctomycetota bacterium]